MSQQLKINLDRKLKTPLAEQIRLGIEQAIISGTLQLGDRLPSWIDLASQLGVSRGTVKVAYERLSDGQFIIASRSQGTRVAYQAVKPPSTQDDYKNSSFTQMYLDMTTLFSLDTAGRVIHLGSFSKTISPKLRIGFAVVPFHMINHFAETTATLVPAPSPSLQLSIQEFMHEGHFLRHLRRTKRNYSAQRDELIKYLKRFNLQTYTAGLSVLINLPPSLSDQKIVNEALAFNLAPSPLSLWYQDPKNAVFRFNVRCCNLTLIKRKSVM